MIIIGLLGRKRSGKDTFAARLVDAHGFTRYAFADALKDAALALDPIIGQQDLGHQFPGTVRLSHHVRQYGWEAAKEHPEVRRTLQNMGVGVRNLDPDFWLRHVVDVVRSMGENAVITDVRFPNEADAIHALGGYLVRIVRPGNPTDDTHISETALDNYRVEEEILNRTDVQALHLNADSLVHAIRWADDAVSEPPC